MVFPLLLTKQLPAGINHFRIGESLYFGNNLFTNEKVKGMKDDVFTFHAQIIELKEKPIVPYGELAQNPSGEEFDVREEDYGKTSHRAILDFGLLDVSTDFLIPKDPNVKISGASSDMVVVDIGKNKEKYKVGDWIDFSLKYMGALSLLNSDYVEKTII